MKYFFTIVFFGFFSILSADFHTDIYKGVSAAKKSGKIVSLFIVSSDCPHCKELLKLVDLDKDLGSLIMEKTELVILNTKDPLTEVPTDLPYKGRVPVFMTLTPNGKVVGKALDGSISPALIHSHIYKVTSLWDLWLRGQ